jgi:hypothetical protein
VLPNADTAQRDADALLRDIEMQALPRGRALHEAVFFVVLLVATLSSAATPSTLHGQSGSRPHTPVQSTATGPGSGASDLDVMKVLADARRAYTQRAYLEATERFGVVAREFPTDADVLINWGTAAWAANDTVTTVIAWQRAARLDPMAPDIARRLGVLPSGARGGVADVPMIPIPWLLRISVVCWVAGWLMLSWVSWRTRTPAVVASVSQADDRPIARPVERSIMSQLRRASVALVLGGVITGATAWWGMRALDAGRLYVVSRPETLRIAPGSDADAMGGVSTGDVVEVVESRPNWQRVQHADGRRGWLPGARLVAISPTSDAPARE